MSRTLTRNGTEAIEDNLYKGNPAIQPIVKQRVFLEIIDGRKCYTCHNLATHTLYWECLKPGDKPQMPHKSFNYCLDCGKKELKEYVRGDCTYGIEFE